MIEPALAMIEFKSVAKGFKTTDEMVKKAPVRVLETHAICPGKYMVLICGEVADVEESLKKGIEIGHDMIVSHMFLPHAHPDLIPAITGTNVIDHFGALGIVETFSIATCVEAADIAAKATDSKLVEVRLANGLGGKGYFMITGALCDVQASMERAKEFVKNTGMLAGCEIIEAPHPEMLARGVY